MKLQKQAKVPTIEIDLSRIQRLSQEHDDENWKFRSWLKQYAPDDMFGFPSRERPAFVTRISGLSTRNWRGDQSGCRRQA
jgi:hypothetical protein